MILLSPTMTLLFAAWFILDLVLWIYRLYTGQKDTLPRAFKLTAAFIAVIGALFFFNIYYTWLTIEQTRIFSRLFFVVYLSNNSFDHIYAHWIEQRLKQRARENGRY